MNNKSMVKSIGVASAVLLVCGLSGCVYGPPPAPVAYAAPAPAYYAPGYYAAPAYPAYGYYAGPAVSIGIGGRGYYGRYR